MPPVPASNSTSLQRGVARSSTCTFCVQQARSYHRAFHEIKAVGGPAGAYPNKPSTYFSENVTTRTSVSQLSYSFHGGLRRTNRIYETAAKLGRLDLLQCAVLNGCPIGKMVCAEAALRGHLGIIRWARAYGSEWDDSTCSAAASWRHLKILQYCREHGCPWNAGTTALAARCGSLSVLKWARENGCDWGEYTCTSAALGGHFEILMWCRGQGCGWSEETAAVAAPRGHWGVLQFCLENGCPRDPDNMEKETGQETDGVAEGCPAPDTEMSPAGPEPIRQDFTTAQSSSLEIHHPTHDELERARKYCAFHAVIYGDDAPPSEIEEALLRLDPFFSDEDY